MPYCRISNALRRAPRIQWLTPGCGMQLLRCLLNRLCRTACGQCLPEIPERGSAAPNGANSRYIWLHDIAGDNAKPRTVPPEKGLQV
jgi:hypothetical protein